MIHFGPKPEPTKIGASRNRKARNPEDGRPTGQIPGLEVAVGDELGGVTVLHRDIVGKALAR